MRNFSNLAWYGDQKNVEIDKTRGLSKSVLVVCLNKHKAKKKKVLPQNCKQDVF